MQLSSRIIAILLLQSHATRLDVDLNVNITGKVFIQADNSDDWLDVKYAGSRGNVAPADKIKEDQ